MDIQKILSNKKLNLDVLKVVSMVGKRNLKSGMHFTHQQLQNISMVIKVIKKSDPLQLKFIGEFVIYIVKRYEVFSSIELTWLHLTCDATKLENSIPHLSVVHKQTNLTLPCKDHGAYATLSSCVSVTIAFDL
jgi:hypothetical protein